MATAETRDRHPPQYLDDYEWDEEQNKRVTGSTVPHTQGVATFQPQLTWTPGGRGRSISGDQVKTPGLNSSPIQNARSTSSCRSLTSRRHELELKALEEEAKLRERKRQLEEERVKEELEILEKRKKLELSMLDDEDNSSQHLSEDEEDGRLNLQKTNRTKEWIDSKSGNHQNVRFENETNGQPMVSVDTLTKAFAEAMKTSKTADVPSKFMARQSVGKDLPIFSSKPEEWPMFWSAYERTTKDCGFTSSENVSRLQKCLKGEALKTVQCLLISPDSLHTSLELLKTRFGRAEHIIETLIEKTKLIPSVKIDKLETLIDFGISVQNLVETIRSLKSSNHLVNPTLLKELEQKLPPSLQMEWAEWIEESPTREKDISHFACWTDKKMKTACQLSAPTIRDDHSERKERKDWNKQKKPRETVLTSTEDKHRESTQASCLFCKKNGHSLEVCRSFLKEAVPARWTAVKNLKICFVCLKPNHRSDDCKESRGCQVDDCGKLHHKVLHYSTPRKPSPLKKDLPKKNEVKEVPVDVCTSISGKSRKGKLLRIINVKLRGPSGVLETSAILDDGSSVTMLKSSIAEQLGLRGRYEPFCVKWFDSHLRKEENSMMVKLEIAGSYQGAKFYTMEDVRTIED